MPEPQYTLKQLEVGELSDYLCPTKKELYLCDEDFGGLFQVRGYLRGHRPCASAVRIGRAP